MSLGLNSIGLTALGLDGTVLAGGGGASTAISATTADSAGAVSSKPLPKLSINATLANAVGAWSSSSGSASSTIAATTGNAVGAVTSVGDTSLGTFTSEPLRDNTGALITSKALNFVALYNDTTGALVVRRTGLSTNGSGVVSFSDAALTSGVVYRADWEDVDGKRRMPRKAAT